MAGLRLVIATAIKMNKICNKGMKNLQYQKILLLLKKMKWKKLVKLFFCTNYFLTFKILCRF